MLGMRSWLLGKRNKKVDYVGTYLASWASPRNEVKRFGKANLERERQRLRETRDTVYGLFR